MYKLLLCLRYLKTRYIALASVISVMLGVATMIVVNSVMAGFAREMQDRLHGILSDVVVDVKTMEGIPDAKRHMDAIRDVAGDSIAGMTPAVAVPAMLSFRFFNETVTRQVTLIGIDEETQGEVSDFCKYLQHPTNREPHGMKFQLHENGYDACNHESGVNRDQMKQAGAKYRREKAKLEVFDKPLQSAEKTPPAAEAEQTESGSPEQTEPQDIFSSKEDPFQQHPIGPKPQETDPAKPRTGLVLGIAMASFREKDKERFVLLPGDDVSVSFFTAGMPPQIVSDKFTIVDLYECKMSEYDSNFVFVPIRKLQELRGMIDPKTGISNFNSIQIKLKPGADGDEVRDKLQKALPAHTYMVQTWRDKQGALLAAVHMETAILNLLLFLIIAVSGFGILAIFFMIVVEKTRDIGVLKSLGASATGIMGIFLSYGLTLGLVGSGIGLACGLMLVWYINDIANVLGRITGRPVFDPSIYYFNKIPTLVDPWTVAWIVSGAVGIAILASILPAMRAALLHPVEALRYE